MTHVIVMIASYMIIGLLMCLSALMVNPELRDRKRIEPAIYLMWALWPLALVIALLSGGVHNFLKNIRATSILFALQGTVMYFFWDGVPWA